MFNVLRRYSTANMSAFIVLTRCQVFREDMGSTDAYHLHYFIVPLHRHRHCLLLWPGAARYRITQVVPIPTVYLTTQFVNIQPELYPPKQKTPYKQTLPQQ